MTVWRAKVGGWRDFHTYERAFRRAAEFAQKTGHELTIYEVDEEGNETPVAVFKAKKRRLIDHE